jgi:hypothetical protein
VEPVAVQYRVGAAGPFAAVPGGYVADATGGPGEATKVTRLELTLPAAADGQPLVQVRVITTNAVGQDEWLGVDDIAVTAARVDVGGSCPGPGPAPAPPPWPAPAPNPPTEGPPELTRLELAPSTFTPARRGPAVVRRGRAGAALRFRLSRAALVRLQVIRALGRPDELRPKLARTTTGGRFSVRGRRGLNRLRFSGRLRGRPLAPGEYALRAVAVDGAARTSAPAVVRFRIDRAQA